MRYNVTIKSLELALTHGKPLVAFAGFLESAKNCIKNKRINVALKPYRTATRLDIRIVLDLRKNGLHK